MKLIFYIYVFLISLCIGSFVNVLIYRLPRHENVVVGRSYCPQCKQNLKPKELIPLISYILLKGKCSSCKEKISIQYPIVELISGCAGLYCFHRFGFSSEMVFTFLLIEVLLAISVIDIQTMTIPDELNLALLVLAFLHILSRNGSLINSVINALIIPLFLFTMNRCVKESFGGGDIKLSFVLGLYLGARNAFLAFVLSTLLAGLVAIFLLIRKKASRKSYLPFGPFLSVGCVLSVLYGHQIIYLYSHLLT